MQLITYLKIIAKNFIVFALIILISTIAAITFSQLKGKTYQATAIFSVEGVGSITNKNSEGTENYYSYNQKG
jgi:uncharacterized protein involved in exopolysaccharide biosynthesis